MMFLVSEATRVARKSGIRTEPFGSQECYEVFVRE